MAARSDDFNRADNASSLGTPSDGGSAWVAGVGTWGISSNTAYNPSSAAYAAAVLECSNGDGTVQVTLSTHALYDAVCVRYSDASNYILLFFDPGNTRFTKIQAGSPTDLAGAVTATYANGDVIAVTLNGTSLSATKNGSALCSTTSSFNQTATKHGLGGYTASAARYDAFSFADPVIPNGTTIAAGDWSSASTWANGYVPGNGDNDLHVKHAVAVSDSRTVGSSPGNAAATKAITVDSAGSLTVQSGGTLHVRGDVEVLSTQASAVTVQGGGVWEFDSSAASSPSTTNYTCRFNGGTSTYLTASGSANGGDSTTKVLQTSGGTHAVVRSNSGGGNGYFTTNSFDRLNLNLSYAEITRVGDATNKAFDLNPLNVANNHTADHVTFDGCGDVYYSQSQLAAAGLSVTYCRWKNTAGAFGPRLAAAAASGGAARALSGCSFDKPAYFAATLAPSGCHFGAGFTNVGGGAGTGFSDNFVVFPDAGGLPAYGDWSGCYLLAHGFDDNPHILIPQDVGSAKTVSDYVCEFTGQTLTDAGNMPYGTGEWTFLRGIHLPSAVQAGFTVGAFTMTKGGGAGVKVVHCTLYTPRYNGGVLVGDSAPATGDYAEARDNLFWAEPSDAGAVAVTVINGPAPDDVVTPAGVHHNGRLNLATPAYEGTYPTTQPGADDIVLPDSAPVGTLSNPYRNVATWAVARGSAAGTYLLKVADALAYLAADPTLLADLLAHVRAGFAPVRVDLQNAASDGTDVGAVQGAGTFQQAALGGAWPLKRTYRPAAFKPGVAR